MTKQKIVPFLFEGEQMVRVIDRDGAPWFVAADICRVLGIEKHRDAIAKLDEDERGSVELDTLGGRQALAAVSESGLYTLVLRSRDATKPGTVAHRFRKWVTAEVLPAIRQHGAYVPPPSTAPEPQEAPGTLTPKPFHEWSLEETRVKLSVVNAYRHNYNVAAAAWVMRQTGFPVPPKHLCPAWMQQEMEFGGLAQPGAITVIVPQTQNGRAH